MISRSTGTRLISCYAHDTRLYPMYVRPTRTPLPQFVRGNCSGLQHFILVHRLLRSEMSTSRQNMFYSHIYGVPFSHLFTELQISRIEVHISPIQLQISPNRPNLRYPQFHCRYLQLNCRYLQIDSIWRYLKLNWRYLQRNCRYLQIGGIWRLSAIYSHIITWELEISPNTPIWRYLQFNWIYL